MNSPIFIVGVPRSGTTLLTAMLSSHPKIAVAPETHFISHDFRVHQHLDLADQENAKRVLDHFVSGQRFPSLEIDSDEFRDSAMALQPRSFQSVFRHLMDSYLQKVGKERWGEKTPGHYLHIDTIFEWFPDAKVIFIFRDPRAVASSLVGVPWGNPYVTFHSKRWVDAVAIKEKHKADSRVHVMTYESLVQSSETTLAAICDFLGEDYDPMMLQRSGCTLSDQGNQWQRGHLSKAISEPINTDALEKWRKVLSSGQVAKIEWMTAQHFEEFGYEPVSHSPKYWCQISTTFERVQSRLVLGLKRQWGLMTGKYESVPR